MTPAPLRVALDASALLALVLRERGAETIDALLAVSCVPVSAMVEVLYRAGARGHQMPAHRLYDDLLALGLDVEPVRGDDAVRAAELVASSRSSPAPGSLSLGDGLCIAVAERLGLPLTGGDRYWSQDQMRVPFLPFR